MNKKIRLIPGTMTFSESVFHPDAEAFIQTLPHAGYEELDTAYMYNRGQYGALLGEVIKRMGRDKIKIPTKVSSRISGKLDGEAAFKQLNESLDRLGTDSVDTFYLRFPNLDTPVESVLEVCTALYDQGKYRKPGLSNFPAWLTVDVYHKCREHGWVLPTVYEGTCNPLTREAETELNIVLDHFGMRFYAYSLMIGGLLIGRYDKFGETLAEERFTHRSNYQKRHWRRSYFDTVDAVKTTCGRNDTNIIEVVCRWPTYHSMLDERWGDAILVGAFKLSHLKQNMEAVNAGPLSSDVVDAFSSAWEPCKAGSPECFTFYKGTVKE